MWWMLRTATRGFAEPGRLLIATMEATVKAGERGSHWYQARVDSIEPVRSAHLVEIVAAPPAWVAEARDIVGRQSVLTLDHPLLDQVYVSWWVIFMGLPGNLSSSALATAENGGCDSPR